MALEPEEQEELAALVEEQSDIIREMAITQNAMLSLLLDKGYMTSEELEESRALIQQQIADA